jgi:hypothetical protein
MDRQHVRYLFSIVIMLLLITTSVAGITELTGADRSEIESAPPAESITVATSNVKDNDGIFAWDSAGSLLFKNTTFHEYFEVRQVPNTRATVVYAAASHPKRLDCRRCRGNFLVKLNVTTGEQEVIFSRMYVNGKIHGFDLSNRGIYIGDIANDRIFLYDRDTHTTRWAWSAHQVYDPFDSGGPYPYDWTHLNDVDRLEDGRLVVSLRNHDSVVFLNKSGLQNSWTLGSDDEHDVLYEQHNPDYIPPERGGPSLVVADSENDRIIEYQRVNKTWERSWTWRDTRLQWPRDADRLPNNNTLVTDSLGDRIIEVNETGSVVWEVHIKGPYEADRLNTGRGHSAAASGLESRTTGNAPTGYTGFGGATGFERTMLEIKDLFPGTLINAVLWILPSWVSFTMLFGLLLVLSVVGLWGLTEAWWRGYYLRWPLRR